MLKIKDYKYDYAIVLRYSRDLSNTNDDLNYFCVDESYISINSKDNRHEYINTLSDEPIKFEEGDVISIFPDGTIQNVYGRNTHDPVLFITSKCNSNCKMCPSSEISRKIDSIPDTRFLIEILDHLPDDMNHLTITGGEPFIIKQELFKILEHAKATRPNVSYLMLSNARALCMDKYVNEFARTTPDNMVIAVPLHGSSADSHDNIVQCKGAFDQTISGISKLLHNHIAVEIRIVVSKLNVKDITHIAEMIISKFPDILIVNFIGLEMLGNALRNKDDVWVDYHTAFNSCKAAINKLIMSGINVGLYNFPLCCVDKRYWSLCQNSITDYKIRYPEKCEQCIEKEKCGGLFFSSLKFANEEIEPITNNYD